MDITLSRFFVFSSCVFKLLSLIKHYPPPSCVKVSVMPKLALDSDSFPAQKTERKKKVSWEDSDDELGEDGELVYMSKHDGVKRYGDRLVERFQLTYGKTPSWARRERKKRKRFDEEEDESGVDKDDITAQQKVLPKRELGIVKLADLNATERAEGKIIRSINFHPKSPVALVAGSSDVISLYQVDGSSNPKVQSVNLENFNLRNACFSADGNEVYASSGKSGYFYVYDMLSGNVAKVKPSKITENETVRNVTCSPDGLHMVALGHQGNLYLLSRRTKEIVSEFRVNGEANSAQFSPDSRYLNAIGDSGEVYSWDVSTRQCISKFEDDGCVNGTVVACSNSYLATGANSGIVNVYERLRSDQTEHPYWSNDPKIIKNLLTPVKLIHINHSEQLMAIASGEKNNAIRLVHFPSCAVYQNFPFLNSNLGRINSVAFSPSSGYLSVGNNRGCAYLFRLSHFDKY